VGDERVLSKAKAEEKAELSALSEHFDEAFNTAQERFRPT